MRIGLPTRQILALWAVLFFAGISYADSQNGNAGAQEPAGPMISLPENVGEAITKEAVEVTQEIQKQAATLFIRSSLGWDLRTIDYLYEWLLGLPLRVPELMREIAVHSHLLGLAGSLVMLTFIVAVIYSLIGQHRVMRRIESAVEPVRHRVPQELYPVFLAAARVVVAAAIPLLLLGAFSLINAAITYRAAWFALTGDLLLIWSAAALAIRFLRELLTRHLFKVTAAYGPKIFRLTRLVLLYGVACVALLQAAEAFAFRRDVLSFLRFAISVSVVCLFLLLVLNKRALLSFLPELPYRSYRRYVVVLKRYYYPLIGLSFVLALVWCFGFREFGRLVLVKIWSTVGALVLLSLAYHALRIGLNRWSARIPPEAESAHGLFRSARSFLVYAAAVIAASLLLNMIGLLDPLERLLSFQVVKVGSAGLTFWILIKAILVLLFFVYGSRLLQAYLDYKVYPALGVDSGLGYAINTILRLGSLGLGFLIALSTLGVDLGYLLVFAGAIGVGIGLGLQNMASHLISGLIIIFGGQIRKGDWIKVEDGIGMVTDIHLMSTRVRTRGNVEHLIPNSSLLSNTVVNYSLSSSLIWTSLSVGVSYDADPQRVERILMDVAEKEATVSHQEKPRVLFTGFGQSSLDFQLAVPMDVRLNAERVVQSNLYFTIFAEFKKAGIEIPYPQRDIHVRTPAGEEGSKLEARS